jgi:hypothetical protein
MRKWSQQSLQRGGALATMTMEAETEAKGVSSEESMNEPDSSEEKLMCKRARGPNDGDTSSTESEHDPVRTLSSVHSNDGSNDDDDDDDF